MGAGGRGGHIHPPLCFLILVFLVMFPHIQIRSTALELVGGGACKHSVIMAFNGVGGGAYKHYIVLELW